MEILLSKFSFSIVDLDNNMNRREQEDLFNFIIKESMEKMKNELISKEYNCNSLSENFLKLVDLWV